MQRDLFWFDRPSRDFAGINAALAFGNGYMGGQVEDNLVFETITLNESTMFTGAPYENHVEGACRYLEELRKKTLEGQPCDVEWGSRFVGMFGGQIFAPAGNLVVHTDVLKGVSGYRKQIDLRNGVLSTTFKEGEVFFQKTYFANYKHNVIVLKYESSRPRSYTFEYLSKTDGKIEFAEDGSMVFTGSVPGGKGTDGAVRYCVCYSVRTDGKAEVIRHKTRVAEATFCEVYLTIQTNFVSPSEFSSSYREKALSRLQAAREAGYESLYREHTAYFSEQYGRTAVEFDYPESGRPVNALIEDYPEDKNIELIEKMFQFDKYLIISCSQAGSEPPNLQGIWNADFTPPWDSKYTVNINLEMNYWSVGALNLCEFAAPLFEKLNRLIPHGKTVARELYGIERGDAWCLHHNTDLWDVCGAIDGPWGLTPVCGAWLINTAFDFYRYTGEVCLLEKLYGAIKGAVEFFAEFLIDYTAGDQTYKITCPSTSPERTNGKQGYVSYGSMHDNQMIRQLLENYIETENVLGRDEALKAEAENLLKRLPPPASISSDKVLKEFYFHDNDSAEDTHRHLSHLYGLHPGSVMHVSGNEEWLKAAEYTLDCRSKEGDWAGWGIVWRIYLYSRLFCAEKAGRMLDLLFDEQNGLLLPNGFAAHPYECGHIFQYDANAGFPGALLEMFVSCPKDAIRLLPAVPARFQSGRIRGVRTFGGFVVEDLVFRDGTVVSCKILSENGGALSVEIKGRRLSCDTERGERYAVGEGGFVLQKISDAK